MEHLNNFTIESFRGLRNLKIENLGQINLFVGNNNSGKTSVLEAASLFCDPLNWRRWYDIVSLREPFGFSRTSLIDRLIWLFPSGNIDKVNAQASTTISLLASGNAPITALSASYEKFTELVTTVSKGEERAIDEKEVEIEGIKVSISLLPKYMQQSLFSETSETMEQTLTFSDNSLMASATRKQQRITLASQTVNPFSHRTGSLTSSLWSEVVEADLKKETIKLLQFFDPAIQDVDFISPTERKQLISIKHAKLGRAPLYTFGDGLRRVFTLAASIPRVKGGLLLIDELETAIHTTALEKTFSWLVKACVDNDIQLLATTHSLEALDMVLDASRKRGNLVVYRLQQDQTQTSVTRLDTEMTLRLREELGTEVRY